MLSPASLYPKSGSTRWIAWGSCALVVSLLNACLTPDFNFSEDSQTSDNNEADPSSSPPSSGGIPSAGGMPSSGGRGDSSDDGEGMAGQQVCSTPDCLSDCPTRDGGCIPVDSERTQEDCETEEECPSDSCTPGEIATACGGCVGSSDRPPFDCTSSRGSHEIAEVACESECKVLSCADDGHNDCDGVFENGCEVDTMSDPRHCGGCQGRGGTECLSPANAKSRCERGECRSQCLQGFLDANGDLQASTSDGCETKRVTPVTLGTTGQLVPGARQLTVSHELEGAPGSDRALLVGTLCRGNLPEECLMQIASYAGAPLRVLEPGFSAKSDLYAGIYYALDEDLPDPGTYEVLLAPGSSQSTLIVEAVELTGAAQDALFSDHAGVFTTQHCDRELIDLSLPLDGLPAGTLSYALVGGFGGQTANIRQPFASSVEDLSAGGLLFGSGLAVLAPNTIIASAMLEGCDRSVLYAVGVSPARGSE